MLTNCPEKDAFKIIDDVQLVVKLKIFDSKGGGITCNSSVKYLTVENLPIYQEFTNKPKVFENKSL